MSIKLFAITAAAAAVLAGCTHETASIAGKGGSATLTVYPEHHDSAQHLINFKVYLKYNTQDAPANDVYDDSVLCINHDSLVSGSFMGLRNGNYYLYGKGYDTVYKAPVEGGLPYKVVNQAPQSVELRVSE